MDPISGEIGYSEIGYGEIGGDGRITDFTRVTIMFDPAPSWYARARHRLVELRCDANGWGTSVRGAADPETTVWACLALLATEEQSALVDTLELVDASANWLSLNQHADGAVGPATGDRASLCRSTACAALLWSQLLHYRRPLASALRWLQQCGVLSPVTLDDPIPGRVVPDMTGPTSQATPPTEFPLESAALALLALCCNQLAGHQQVATTVRWILEQSRASGGWEPAHESLSDDPWASAAGSTGLVLLALRAAGLSETFDVTRACDYLQLVLPSVDFAPLLSWALLGYQVWRPRPTAAAQWLADCEACAQSEDSSTGLALLLLGHHPQTLSLLGVTPAGQEETAGSVVPPECQVS